MSPDPKVKRDWGYEWHSLEASFLALKGCSWGPRGLQRPLEGQHVRDVGKVSTAVGEWWGNRNLNFSPVVTQVSWAWEWWAAGKDHMTPCPF
jgi:hypothetical protein